MAKITLSNIKGYIQAHFRQALEDLDFLPEHIKEQAQWRLKQIAEKSPECLEKDSCVICSCQVSSKVFEDRACEGKCYPEMFSKEAWEEGVFISNDYNHTDNGHYIQRATKKKSDS